MVNERLKKLKELEITYIKEINLLQKEIELEESNFKAYSDEVIANGKKRDKRMTFAGISISAGTFLSTMIFPLSGGNPIVCVFTISLLIGGLVNGIVQWVKSEKCDKKIEELKTLELDKYDRVLKLKEKIAILEQNKLKVKCEILKLEEQPEPTVNAVENKKILSSKKEITESNQKVEIIK